MKISENMRHACYGISGLGGRFQDYPNKRTATALVRRGLARWIEPGEVVLALTDDGRRVAADYNKELFNL